MSKEELYKAKTIIDEINKLDEICETLNDEIEQYSFEPPTRMTSFDLFYQNKHKKNLNEGEVKSLHDILKSEIDKLTKELKQII